MGIIHKDETDVYCDTCGRWLIGWNKHINNLSAKYTIQEEGATTGSKIICRQCRAAKKRETCVLIKNHLIQGQKKPDVFGYTCGGYKVEHSDTPCEPCKECIAYDGLDMNAYADYVRTRRYKKYHK